MRPTLKGIYDMSNPDTKRRVMSSVGTFNGMYEFQAMPRRNTRSLQQNAAWWGMIVTPLFEFLSAQDCDVNNPGEVHEWLKEHFLRTPIINKRTGEVVAYRVRGTSQLSKEEFTDLFDRARTWMQQNTGIIVPDPDPYYRREAVAS